LFCSYYDDPWAHYNSRSYDDFWAHYNSRSYDDFWAHYNSRSYDKLYREPNLWAQYNKPSEFCGSFLP